MIKLASIGTNFVVDWFLDSCKQVEDIKYIATYSRKEDVAREFSKKHNGELIFTDLNELAKSKDINAVYIASPNSLHYEQAKLMIENGKHVLIEKTIASNKKELDSLVDLAKKMDVVIMEAMRPAHDPGLKMIQKSFEKIKPIRRVTIQMCQYSSRYNKYKDGIIENAFNPKFSNGALTDIGVYCVHPMVKMFGRPEKVMAMATILPDSIDGQGTIIAQYKDMLATIMYSKISNGKVPSEIQGEKGSIIIDHIDNPRNAIIKYNNGTEEKLDIPKCDSNLVYEAKEWARLVNIGKYTDEHIKYSVMELEIMDEARKQQNIVFPADKPKVAFVCVHNSCRSQIAEALGKKLASDVFESYSAGTELKDKINQDAVRIMKKLYGIDMEENQKSKLLENIPSPDVVILMGCNVSCPIVESQYTENWGLDDPTGKTDEEFEKIIKLIEEKILNLKKKLSVKKGL